MNNAALAVIEEALWGARRGVELEADVYAKREAPAVLSRVLAALGGEPVGFGVFAENEGRETCDFSTDREEWAISRAQVLRERGWPRITIRPLYAAPPIDLAAVRAVADELRADNGYWSGRLLRAIGGSK